MKKIIVALTLIAGGVSVAPTSLAVESGQAPPLCGPTTAGTGAECDAPKYVSFVKSFNECGFEKGCSDRGTYAEYPSLECYYVGGGQVSCDAWPQTWPETSDPITYLWSTGSGLSIPPGFGEHSPAVDISCLPPRNGGVVFVQMLAPGGTNWVQLSVGISCRYEDPN